MTPLEAKDVGYNKYVIKKLIRENINSANAAPSRSKGLQHVFTRSGKVETTQFVKQMIKKHGAKNYACYNEIRNHYEPLATAAFPTLAAAHRDRLVKLRDGVWQACCWELPDTPFASLHCAHVSETDPSMVAFTADEDKLLRNVQTRMKPGRYLMKFYSELLTEAECKKWADLWAANLLPVELRMIPNTDPDGWEWVYENSVYSCMRYNRSSRYLNHGCYGDDHPVRAYAHPHNDLALAYILKPGVEEDRSYRCKTDEVIITARTIVNTDDKTWLRTYADDDRERSKLVKLLEAEGYSQSRSALQNQKLVLRRYDDNILCPYLDGDYTSVDIGHDYLRVGDDGVDAQNACGQLDENYCTCPMCDERCDEDDLIYVDRRGGSVCRSCLDEYYTYAYVNSRSRDYVSNNDVVEVNGEYYDTDCLADHDIYECGVCGEYAHIDDLVTLENGDQVCDHHAAMCAVTDECYLRTELVETEFDGRIYEDYAVELYPSGLMGWKEKCFTLTTTHGVLYVHEDVMGSPQLNDLFVQFGELLLPKTLNGHTFFGEPVTTDLVPNNVEDGSECTCSITEIIESEGEEPATDSNDLELQREPLAA